MDRRSTRDTKIVLSGDPRELENSRQAPGTSLSGRYTYRVYRSRYDGRVRAICLTEELAKLRVVFGTRRVPWIINVDRSARIDPRLFISYKNAADIATLSLILYHFLTLDDPIKLKKHILSSFYNIY